MTTTSVPRRRHVLGVLGDAVRQPQGALGAAMLALVALVSLGGPLVAPHGIEEVVGAPFAPPSGTALLGTDVLGRDVLSRLLHGGVALLSVAISATILAYLIGATWGMAVSLLGRWIDVASIGLVDVLLSLPPLVIGLVLLAGAGSGNLTIAIALAAIQAPRVFRIVRAASREVAAQDYVEAAFARGESRWTVLRRDVLANIWTPMLTDFGLRITSSVILFSSLSFLGLGAPPPSPDWGQMISENQIGLAAQPWGVIVPVVLIAVLSVGTNLLTDTVARLLHRGSEGV
ncbi:MAG: ABC transporter permease [Nocardioides sp.]|uniref:ABC transporter permease n=1 Tax=Nocardioides sp. TaxID=35761 RepID=UPI0039E29E51